MTVRHLEQTTLEVLVATKALIDSPKKWCQGDYYHNGRRCVVGALRATTAFAVAAVTNSAAGLLDACAKVHGHSTAIYFNDAPETTHADVMALMDEAIALARQEEQK